jgi:hypothetical protein
MRRRILDEVDSMRRSSFARGLFCAALFATAVLCSTCSPSSAPPSEAKPTASSPAGRTPMLWGDVTPVVSVKELMRDLIDPIADNIFEAVNIIVTKAGEVEKTPKTDEDWQRIQTGAVGIAEGAELLRIRRPFAPPGDLNNSVGPDAAELAPAQITAKVEKDPVEWNARVQAMRNVGLEVIDIVKRKDAKELWDAAENLEAACENCHRSYWYPGENAEFYEKLNRRLREAGPGTPPPGRKQPAK